MRSLVQARRPMRWQPKVLKLELTMFAIKKPVLFSIFRAWFLGRPTHIPPAKRWSGLWVITSLPGRCVEVDRLFLLSCNEP